MKDLIVLKKEGMYCPLGKFFLDPILPVDKAVISHGHADHARNGNRNILCSAKSMRIIKQRTDTPNLQSLEFGRELTINDIKLSFFPASHVLGASQIRLRSKDSTWVYTGDFRLVKDSSCDEFEPVKSDVLVMESTFGLPIFQWKREDVLFKELTDIWQSASSGKKNLILYCYSLGKAQRVLCGIKKYLGSGSYPTQIYVHKNCYDICRIYKSFGISLPEVKKLEDYDIHEKNQPSLIILPPALKRTQQAKKYRPSVRVFVSGWMAIRGNRRRETGCKGLALSDHADWSELNELVNITKPQTVIAVHGKTSILTRYLNEKGVNTDRLKRTSL